MTAPVWMPRPREGFRVIQQRPLAPAASPATSLLMKTIFSKLCRQGQCRQRHNWRGEPAIGRTPWSEPPRGLTSGPPHRAGNLDS
jgi:hypothetical protein